MPISPELQAKIDALPYEDLKADILHTLNGPGKKRATDEAIFETAVSGYMEAMAQRARLRQWRDDEVRAFIEHFKQEMPQGYAEFLRQEREDHEIDGDLWWATKFLAERWLPGLDSSDYTELLGKVRDHVQAHLI